MVPRNGHEQSDQAAPVCRRPPWTKSQSCQHTHHDLILLAVPPRNALQLELVRSNGNLSVGSLKVCSVPQKLMERKQMLEWPHPGQNVLNPTGDVGLEILHRGIEPALWHFIDVAAFLLSLSPVVFPDGETAGDHRHPVRQCRCLPGAQHETGIEFLLRLEQACLVQLRVSRRPHCCQQLCIARRGLQKQVVDRQSRFRYLEGQNKRMGCPPCTRHCATVVQAEKLVFRASLLCKNMHERKMPPPNDLTHLGVERLPPLLLQARQATCHMPNPSHLRAPPRNDRRTHALKPRSRLHEWRWQGRKLRQRVLGLKACSPPVLIWWQISWQQGRQRTPSWLETCRSRQRCSMQTPSAWRAEAVSVRHQTQKHFWAGTQPQGRRRWKFMHRLGVTHTIGVARHFLTWLRKGQKAIFFTKASKLLAKARLPNSNLTSLHRLAVLDPAMLLPTPFDVADVQTAGRTLISILALARVPTVANCRSTLGLLDDIAISVFVGLFTLLAKGGRNGAVRAKLPCPRQLWHARFDGFT